MIRSFWNWYWTQNEEKTTSENKTLQLNSTNVLTAFPDPDDTVILLCDVQTYFKKVVEDWDTMIASITFLLKTAKSFNIPVLTTEQVPKVFGSTEPSLKKQLPAPSQILLKSQFSMCSHEISEALKRYDRKNIVLVGLEAHICILQTCLDLLQFGYNVYLPSDAIHSQRKEDRMRALERLGAAGACITTSECIVFQFLKDAKHKAFKSVQPAIKEFATNMKKIETGETQLQ